MFTAQSPHPGIGRKSLITIDLIKRALEFNDYFKLLRSPSPITSAVWGDYFEVFVRIFDERGNLVLPMNFCPRPRSMTSPGILTSGGQQCPELG